MRFLFKSAAVLLLLNPPAYASYSFSGIDDLLVFQTRPTTTSTTTTTETAGPDVNPGFPSNSAWQVVASTPSCDVSACGCPSTANGCVRLFDSRAEAYECAESTGCAAEVVYMQVAHFNVCQVGKMYVVPIDASIGNDDDFWAEGTDAFIYLPVVNTAEPPFAPRTIDLYTPRDDSNAAIGLSAGGTSCAVNDEDYERADDGVVSGAVRIANSTALVIEINSLLENTYLGHNHTMLFVRALESRAPPVMVGGYQGFLAIVKDELPTSPSTAAPTVTDTEPHSTESRCVCGAGSTFLPTILATLSSLYLLS